MWYIGLRGRIRGHDVHVFGGREAGGWISFVDVYGTVTAVRTRRDSF
jgi:hypothetical protein